MATIFSKIVRGDIPSYKIDENEHFYAFLDIFPLKKGHTLVIPKKEVDYMYDLDDETLASLHVFSKRIAKAIQASIPCKRIGTAVIGLEVPHAHLHLVPINNVEDINFSQEKLKLSPEEMEEIASKIKSKLENN